MENVARNNLRFVEDDIFILSIRDMRVRIRHRLIVIPPVVLSRDTRRAAHQRSAYDKLHAHDLTPLRGHGSIARIAERKARIWRRVNPAPILTSRSEEHTSELQ